MAVDFPATTGQPTDGSFKFTDPNGQEWSWDGTGWSPVAPAAAAGPRVFQQPTAPASPQAGDVWVDTSDPNHVDRVLNDVYMFGQKSKGYLKMNGGTNAAPTAASSAAVADLRSRGWTITTN
jgi:hypothetical protein